MTKTIEQRIADLNKFLNDPTTRIYLSYHHSALNIEGGIIRSLNDAMSIINDLQAKLKEETQRADLLSLELTKAYDKEHARYLKDEQRVKKLDELTKEVEKVLAENEKLKTKGEWLPIESAPKDEAVLVVYGEPFFGHFDPTIAKAYFDDYSQEWRFELSGRKISTNGVTHWRPLPELPTPPKD